MQELLHCNLPCPEVLQPDKQKFQSHRAQIYQILASLCLGLRFANISLLWELWEGHILIASQAEDFCRSAVVPWGLGIPQIQEVLALPPTMVVLWGCHSRSFISPGGGQQLGRDIPALPWQCHGNVLPGSRGSLWYEGAKSN